MGTESGIKDWVKRQLGHPVVDVELTDDQLQDGVDEAKEWFAMHIGQIKTNSIVTASATNEYDVESDCEAVVEVAFPSEGSGTAVSAFLSGFGGDIGKFELSWLLYGGHYGYGSYSYLTQVLQYLEIGKMAVGADLDWEWDYSNKKLRLFPSFSEGTNIWYAYLVNSIDVTLLKQYEYKLVTDYALSVCMSTLGNIRTKYAEMPSATGGTSLNGDTLLSNAETIRLNTEDKIKRIVRPIGFFVG